MTALHWAAASGSLAAVTLLVEHDARVNVLEFNGEKLAALDYAIIGDGEGTSYTYIVEYLEAHGALSVTTIRDMAAVAIQSAFRGFRERISLRKQRPGAKVKSMRRRSVAKLPPSRHPKPWYPTVVHPLAKSAHVTTICSFLFSFSFVLQHQIHRKCLEPLCHPPVPPSFARALKSAPRPSWSQLRKPILNPSPR